ncbi:replication protein VP4 [Microviridae Fen4707_41]|uniref:replication protein VP4 n=1 Tax=Microviridae Fen4707_41 TaxID=1655654 RepID=UPI00063D5B96|nr:replication protein VP4 [Microviridae Fen4707_41]AKI26912.1 replication protein VP4 [Microviridae Fen4707_41]
MYVPCGKCGNCLRRKIADYTARLQFEARKSDDCYFLTLTFADDPTNFFLDNYSDSFNPFKHQLQKFFKRLRKAGYRFKYFALGDYGDTFGRPHYHVVTFSKASFPVETIHSIWAAGDSLGRGFIDLKPLTPGRISYVVRYGFLAKLDWDKRDDRPPPFFLMSRRPAVGAGYVTPAKIKYHLANQFWFFPDGKYRKALPRYWRDKIFLCPALRKCHLIVYNYQAAVDRQVDILYFKSPEKWQEAHRKQADLYLDLLRKQKNLNKKSYYNEK